MQGVFSFALRRHFDTANSFSHWTAVSTKWDDILLTHFTDKEEGSVRTQDFSKLPIKQVVELISKARPHQLLSS